MIKKIFIFIILSIYTTFVYPQLAPIAYWHFTTPSPLSANIGGASFNITPGTISYTTPSGGPVGSYMEKPITYGASSIMQGGNVNPTASNSISFQFLFKPGRDFQLLVNGTVGGAANVFSAGSTGISFQYPYIIISTSVGAGIQSYIQLNGIGKASWNNLQDGNWHMISVTFNATTGQKRLYIDGQSPNQFIINGTGGTIFNSFPAVVFAGTVDYTMYAGSLDEVAIYYGVLTPNQVWQNYLDFQAGQHYTTAFAASVPAYSPTTASYNPLELMAGYPSVVIDASSQLAAFPSPRYKPIYISADSLFKIRSCTDPYYLGGASQSGISNAQAVLNGVNRGVTLANNYNWVLSLWQIGQALTTTDTTNSIQGKTIARYKSNKKLKLEGVTFRPQLYPFGKLPSDYNQANVNCCIAGCAAAGNYCYPSYYFLQNSSGQFISANGTVTTNKKPRPSYTLAQSYSNFPDTAINQNGDSCNASISRISTTLGPDLNFYSIWENDEDATQLLDAGMNADPVVNANRIASGVNNRTFQATWRSRWETVNYRDRFIGTTTASDSTFYNIYQVQGNPNYFFQWAQMRSTSSTYRGKKLSTADFYVRTPNQWWEAGGANHGLSWMLQNQKEEFASGDSIQSPFVAAGWDVNESNNISPPQWLGLLKYISIKGAETYFSSIFSLGIPNPDPNNYIWQMVAPSYAQAITSRYERYLHYGKLLPGDMYDNPITKSYPSYSYNTGDFRAVCAVRQLGSTAKYVIGTNLNRNANMVGNTQDTVIRSITLAGQSLTFTIRQQGSVYIYDNTNTANPVFYQLDKWHENTHPYYWSTDFNFEAEVNDNYDPQQPVQLKTTQATAGSYVNSTTFVSYSDTTTVLDSIRFNFQPRTAATYYLWVRMKSRTGATTGVTLNLNGGTTYTLPVSNTNWFWYRYDNGTVVAPGINYALTTADQHLALLAINKYVEIDQIVLTQTPNAGYPETTSPCIATSTITPSGSTTFCTGGSVTLTANVNTSYLWNTGATTQAINVTTSGIFTVTVTDGSGCTGVSASTTVTVNTSPPTPVITPLSSTTFCSGSSVNLQATASTSYLWSTGATTQTINVTTASSFTVTVTNASGCTASSATTTTTVNALPSVPTITPTGSTTFCTGSSVLLTSTVATSYLWSTGAVTSAITATTAGSYAVIVTNAAGCTNISLTTVVTVNGNPIIAAIPPQANTCPAVTFDISSLLPLTNSGAAVTTTSYHATLSDAQADINPIAAVVAATAVYYIRSEAATGCYDVSSVSVTITNCLCATPPTCNAGSDATICAGSTKVLSGSRTVATTSRWTTSGTGTFSPNNTTLTPTYTPSSADTISGSVTITLTTDSVTGAPCTNAIDAMVLTISSRPTSVITASGATTFCSGSSVSLVASLNASYLWSTGATTQAITVSSSGTYTVTTTNTSGCTKVSAGTSVTVHAAVPTPNVIPTSSTTLCTGDSVILTCTPTAPSYLWSTGATTQSIYTFLAGTYRVTVTNFAGCTASSAVTTVTSTPAPPIPTITASGATTFCTGGNVVLSAPSGYTYLWSNNATTQSITVTTSGTFTVSVFSSPSCFSTSNVPIVVIVTGTGGTPTINPPNPIFICAGQNIELVVTPSTSYLWSTGETTQNIVVNSTGSYTVTVTSAGGCTNVSAAAIVQSGTSLNPVITVTGSATFCSGDSVLLSSNSATGYAWSNGASTQSIYAKISGSYRVTVTDAYGCTKSSSAKTVTVKATPSTPVITPSGSLTFCNGASVALLAPTNYRYLWSNNATTKTLTVRNSGTFTVTVFNELGCSKTSASVTTVKDTNCTSTCGVPFGLTTTSIQRKQFTLNWAQLNTNGTYKVYIKKTTSGSRTRGPETYPQDVRFCDVLDLKPNTSYYVWMRGTCNGVNTDSTNAFIIKTLP